MKDAGIEANDYSSIMSKIGKDHWRRTYNSDAMTADLHAQWQSIWMELTDVKLIRGMNIDVKEASHFAKEDKYSERQSLTAVGTLDNAALEFIDKASDDYTKFAKVSVAISFERSFNDPPHPKTKWVDADGNALPVDGDEFDGKIDASDTDDGLEKDAREGEEAAPYDIQKIFSGRFVETGEYWSLGECLRGSLDPQVEPGLSWQEGEPELALHLQMPRDFLPTLEKSLSEPERVAGIRMCIYLRCYEEGAQAAFSEPFHHLDFMIERDASSPAYLTAFSLSSNITAPAATLPEIEESEPKSWQRKSQPPAPAPLANPKLDELITWVKYGVFALGALCIILIAGLD